MSADTAALPRRRELALLATLAAIQFTHVVDFMIMMPLAPQLMRLWDIGPQAFGVLVSAYTFAAAASGLLSVFVIDRYDRRHALLALYGGFVLATALCGLAPGYEALLAARVLAGAFGGVLGAQILAIVADTVPYARRARANALIASAFSLAAIVGVPAGLWIATHASWRAPFLAVAAVSVAVGLAASWLIPPVAGHVAHGRSRRPFERVHAIVKEANHWRAFAFMLALMLAGFTVIPFVAAYAVTNVGLLESELPAMYAVGGIATLVTAQVIGRLADRFGKKRVYACVAVASIAPILAVTHMPRASLAWFLPVSTLFFILVPGRFGPAMALISGSAEPRVRGAFMSFNAAVQQLGAGLAAVAAGAMVGRASDGSLDGYGWVGWLAVAFTLASVLLAFRIRVVDTGAGRGRPGDARATPE
ncbi:MAG: MFS transporter [Betaproteobacteria bacterium]|nr:MFS transporter [Betaproteobacteria bacterium]